MKYVYNHFLVNLEVDLHDKLSVNIQEYSHYCFSVGASFVALLKTDSAL